MSESGESLPKILCVDDELSVLDALSRIFRQDFEVLTTTSPREGLRLLQNNLDMAVILSDFRMPEMDGVSFLKEAKAIVPDAVRAILSGQMDMEHLSDAINTAEINRMILKPWNNEVLRLRLLEALQVHNIMKERRELRKLAVTDPVTGLTNHRYFQEKLSKDLEQATESKTPVGLLMIDVDHFKSYNDHYGHPEGDRLLAGVADRITSHFPEKGQASRYGGEEFSVVLPGVDPASCLEQAEKLRKDFEENPFNGPYGQSAHVTVSIGIASFPDHGQTPKDLVSLADKALYDAKGSGRNQCAVAK